VPIHHKSQKGSRKETKVKAKDEEHGNSENDESAELKPPDVPIEQLLEQLVPEHKRPHHNIGLLGWFGKKLDTIEWYKVIGSRCRSFQIQW
jgi:hypothetical protein